MRNAHRANTVLVWSLLCALPSLPWMADCSAGDADSPGPIHLDFAETVVIATPGPDLVDAGESDRMFSPRTVEAYKAGQLFTLELRVRNRGNSASGEFTVAWYASVDTTISNSPSWL